MDILEKIGIRKRPLTDLEMADIMERNGDPDFARWLRERHAKKTAEDEASVEANKYSMSKWEAKLVFYGISAAMAAGTIINPEAMDAFNEAKDILEINRDNQPKPPRRPNIGTVALGHI